MGATKPEPGLPFETVDRILDAIRGLAYGSVEITVHEGCVVQIERKEKVRLDRPRGEKPAPETPAPAEPSTAGKEPNPR